MHILGISCFYHDSAAALVRNGEIVAAAAEERFSGIKHDSGFPNKAVAFCLEKAGIDIAGLDYIVFYDKPFTKFDRILSSYLQTIPRSYPAFRKAIPLWLKEKLWLPHIIKKELHYDGKILFVDHHLSHAAGAYYSSPYEKAAILTIDGVGEWATASMGAGNGNNIELVKSMNYPHSLGLLYSAFTYFLGFQVNSSEYKVMGLAPYGQPQYLDLIEKELVQINEDGSIFLNMKYFNYHFGLTMTGRRFERLFWTKRRRPEEKLNDIHRDLAASIQAVTEKIIFKMAEFVKEQTGQENLCLSGGVALNCAAAGKLLESGRFRDIYIQPSATDSGGALGAALYVYFGLNEKARRTEQDYLSLGPSYTNTEIERFLTEKRIPFKRLEPDQLSAQAARALTDGKITAVFHGPMEFGPRALGFRSILADPRNPEMKTRINGAVKFREPFRPFAPIVLEERAAEYFDCNRPSPYMLFNFRIRPDKREAIPAVTHVDGTARIQTVDRDQNKFVYDIIKEFETITGIPVLLNTSFNLRGHPIVRTPEDAFATFISSGIDILVMEDFLIEKTDVNPDAFPQFRIDWGRD